MHELFCPICLIDLIGWKALFWKMRTRAGRVSKFCRKSNVSSSFRLSVVRALDCLQDSSQGWNFGNLDLMRKMKTMPFPKKNCCEKWSDNFQKLTVTVFTFLQFIFRLNSGEVTFLKFIFPWNTGRIYYFNYDQQA